MRKIKSTKWVKDIMYTEINNLMLCIFIIISVEFLYDDTNIRIAISEPLSFYLFLSPSDSLSLSLSLTLALSINPSLSPRLSHTFSLSPSIPLSLPVFLTLSLSVCPSISVFVYVASFLPLSSIF